MRAKAEADRLQRQQLADEMAARNAQSAKRLRDEAAEETVRRAVTTGALGLLDDGEVYGEVLSDFHWRDFGP
jgi:hypothetical protein